MLLKIQRDMIIMLSFTEYLLGTVLDSLQILTYYNSLKKV